MKAIITHEVQEDIEVIDVLNKFNHNHYVKILKIFGIPVYRYQYEMKTTIAEGKANNQIGFSKSE